LGGKKLDQGDGVEEEREYDDDHYEAMEAEP